MRPEPGLPALWPLVKQEEWSLLVEHLTASKDEFTRKLVHSANSLEDLKKFQALVKFCNELIELKTAVQDAMKRSSRENA